MFGFGKPARPKVVAFDIICTVFPLEPMRPGIVSLGLPPSGLEGWFAAGLRDAFALSAVGDFKPFTGVLEEALVQVLAEQNLSASAAERASLLDMLKQLPSRPDAEQAFTILKSACIRILALTNGSTSSTKSLLENAGLHDMVEHIVSVDDVKLSKPRREVYEHAARKADVEPAELALIAAHGWDINGAKAAGLTTAYISAERPFPQTMRSPDLEDASLSGVARALVDL